MEHFLRKIAVTAAILIAIGFVANLAIDNPYTHRMIRAAINEKVKEYTHLKVDFKALKAAVVPLGVDLYGIKVKSNTGESRNLFETSHAAIRVSLWSLFWGKLSLSSIEITDAQLIWPPPFGFPGFLREDKFPPQQKQQDFTWPLAIDLPLDQLTINNAKIYAEFPLHSAVPEAPEFFVLSLVGLNLDLDYDDPTDASLQFQVSSANASMGPQSLLEDTSIETTVELSGKTISLLNLTLDGERIKSQGDTQISLVTNGRRGVVKRIESKSALRYEGDLSILGSVLDIAETRGLTKGNMHAHVKVPMDEEPATFEITGNARVEDGYLDGFKLFDSSTDFTVTKDSLQLSNILVMIGDTIYGRAEGVLDFNDEVSYRFDIKPDNLRLNDLLSALTVSFDVLDTGITSPDLKLWGTGDPFKMDVTATALFDTFAMANSPDKKLDAVSPSCALDVAIAINGNYLDINQGNGTCYEKAAPRLIRPNHTTAPADAKFPSPLAINGRIYFSDKGLDLSFKSNPLDLALASYFAQVPLAGQAQATSRIYGPYEDIKIASAIEGQDVSLDKIYWDAIAATTVYRDDALSWKDVSLSLQGGGRIQLPQGLLQFDESLTLQTQVEAKGITEKSSHEFLQTFAPDLPLTFSIPGLKGDISGPLLYPGAWEGFVDLDLGEAHFEKERLISSLGGQLRSTKDGWQTKDLHVSLDTLTAKIDFRHKRAFPFLLEEAQLAKNPWTSLGLHPDDTFSIGIKTKKLDYDKAKSKETHDHLGRLPFVGPIMRQAELAGAIELDASFDATTSTAEGTFSGRIARPSVLGSRLSAVDFRGFATQDKLDLVVSHSGNSLEGRLSIDLKDSALPYEWYFNLNRFDLRAFGTKVFYDDPRNYAYLSADWRMAGKFSNWWESTGELNVHDMRTQFVQDIGSETKSIQLRQQAPARLLFQRDGWAFEHGEDLALTGRYFDIRLSLPESHPPENLGFRLTTIVDVEVARAFLQDVDSASGKIRIIAEAKGPVDDPKLSLEVTDLKQNPFIASTWQPVKLGLNNLRPPLNNIKLKAIVEDGRLILDSFTANKGNGTITASGALNLTEDSDTPSRLDINLNEATLIYPVAFLKSFESQISGNAFISGSGFPYTLGGDITVTRARAVQEVNIRDEIIGALRRQNFGSALVTTDPLINFDLNIIANETINIQNRNLQTNLSAEIQLKGTDAQPIVNGQIEVNRGKFIYNRDFTISRGLVTFDNPIKPDPSLDILAFSDISTYRVYIAITGRASDPVVEFSVDPPTTEQGAPITKEEILVLISRGSLPESSRVGGELSDAATSEALNLIMGQFEEPVEKLFDLTGQNIVRNAYFDTYPSENGPVLRLNMPLDLAENFDVIVRLDETVYTYSVEYPVHDSITLSGTIEDRQRDTTDPTETQNSLNGSANLKFRFSFE